MSEVAIGERECGPRILRERGAGEKRRGEDGRAHDGAGRGADEIIDLYWPAVYAFLRRRQYSRDKAAELTQAFFADVVIGRDLFRNADATRGRLRSLIVAALKNFIIDASRREVARGGDRIGPLDAAWLDREESLLTADSSEPDAAFERRWGLAQLEEALRRCEEHFERISKQAHWKAFEARILRPSLRPFEPPPLDQLVGELGFRSPAAVAAAVQVVKRRLVILLEEVAAEVGDDGGGPVDVANGLSGGGRDGQPNGGAPIG